MAPRQKDSPDDVDHDKKIDDNKPQWHTMSIHEVMTALSLSSTVRQDGLSSSDAQMRLEQYGYNKLSEPPKKSLLMRIWAQVANVLVGILVVVAIVSLVKGITADNFDDAFTNYVEVGLITFVVV